MKQVCAWCNKELGTIDSHADSGNVITHGICESCKNNALFQLGVDLRVFLNSLEQPVVMVNQNAAVISVNDEASKLLHKELKDIEGYQGGDVFECAYARLPEGCGNTIHCSGCTIRRTVMKTFETGKSFYRVPATLNRENPENPQKFILLISTEKLNDMVLLRIDKMEMQKAA